MGTSSSKPDNNEREGNKGNKGNKSNKSNKRVSPAETEPLLAPPTDDSFVGGPLEINTPFQAASSPQLIFEGVKLILSLTYSLEVITVMQILLYSSSENQHAAAALIATLMNAVGATVGMLTYGLMTSISETLNNKTLEENGRARLINRYIRDAKKIMVPPAILGALFLIITPYLLEAAGVDSETAHATGEFTQIFAAAIPFFSWRMLNEQQLIAYKDNTFMMISGGISFLLTTIFAVLCNEGHLGADLSGIRSVAVTYTMSEALMAVLFALRTTYAERYQRDSDVALNSYVKDLLKSGGPVALSMLMETLVGVVLTVLANIAGHDEGQQIGDALQFPMTSFLLLLAISIQFNSELSRCIGGQSWSGATTVARRGLVIVSGIAALLALVPIAIPNQFLKLTGGHANADRALRMAGAVVVADAARLDVLNKLRTSLKDPTRPSIISVTCLWLGVGAGAALTFTCDLGTFGLMIGFFVGVLMGLLLNLPGFFSRTSEEGLLSLPRSASTSSFWSLCCLPGGDDHGTDASAAATPRG